MNRRTYIKNTALFLGYAVSASAITDTFLACKNEVQAKLDWQPKFLSPNQANLVAGITETILPKTATPGAKDIGIARFIDRMLNDIYDDKGRKEFVADLKTFDDTCQKTTGKTFLDCSKQEREAFLLKLEKASPKNPPNVWGTNMIVDKNAGEPDFYRKLKGITIWGYFTSEKIAKEVLDYDPIPGPYVGSVPYTGQKNGSGG